MAPRSFGVTFDYRCPFARNAHEHVLDGLAAGAPWDVRFVPFSLSAAKDASWDRAQDSGLLALEVGVAVRDTQPEHFADAHRALFSLRHDAGGNLRSLDELLPALGRVGVDVDAIAATVDGGAALKTIRAEHDAAVAEHRAWGVPTFFFADQAVFVRLMARPADSEIAGAGAIDRILDTMAGWPDLNEFKHTSLPR